MLGTTRYCMTAVASTLTAESQLSPFALQVYVSPFGIKQKPLVRVDTPLLFEVDLAVPLQYQFLPRLEQHFRLSEQAQREYPGKELAVQHYILRPRHQRGDLGFQDKAWSSSEWAAMGVCCLLGCWPATEGLLPISAGTGNCCPAISIQ